MLPEDTSIRQYVASSVPPLLQSDGTLCVPPIAWVASFTASLDCYRAYGGRETDLPDARKNELLLDTLAQHGGRHLDLCVDGAFSPLDATPHATLLHEVRDRLTHWDANHTAKQPLSSTTGTGKPHCSGGVSFQSETGCNRQWDRVPEGNKGKRPTGNDQGRGGVSHEPEGSACSVVYMQCSFCHRAGHVQSACDTKRATQLANYNLYSSLASTAVGTGVEPGGTLTPLQPTPHTDYTFSCTNTPPQTSCNSRIPEGGDPEGTLHRPPQIPLPVPHPTSDQHRAVLGVPIPEGDDPGRDLHTYMEAHSCSSPSWVTLQSVLEADHPHASTGCPAAMSYTQGGTQTQLGSVAVLVGGLEWLVSPSIPPPTSRGPTTGQELSINGPYEPPIHVRDLMEGNRTSSPSRVAPQSALPAEDLHVSLGCLPVSSPAQGGTPIPVLAGLLSDVSQVGGVGDPPNIPPTTDGDLTSGLDLGIHELQIPSMGNSSVAEDSFCILQQVPLATGSTPSGYTRPAYTKPPASSLNCLQPLITIQETPGTSPGTGPTLLCSQVGGRHPAWVTLQDSATTVTGTMDEQGWDGPVEGYPLGIVGPVTHTPPNESTITPPHMPSLDPQPTSDQHRAACGGTAGKPIPGVGAYSAADKAVPFPTSPLALSFGSVPCTTQSSGGGALVGGYDRANMDTRAHTTSPACTTLAMYTMELTNPDHRKNAGLGRGSCTYWLVGGWVATKRVGNHGATSCDCDITCASPQLTWLGGTVESSERTMLLYDVDGTLLQSQSAWQATDSFSLLPGQCGPLNCQYISHLPDILHFDSDPSPSSVDGIPLVTLDCLSDLRCIQEGVATFGDGE